MFEISLAIFILQESYFFLQHFKALQNTFSLFIVESGSTSVIAEAFIFSLRGSPFVAVFADEKFGFASV